MKEYVYEQKRYVCEICGKDSIYKDEICECEKSHCSIVKEFHLCLPDGRVEWTSKGRNEIGRYPKYIHVLYSNGRTVRYRAEDEYDYRKHDKPMYEENWGCKK